MNVVVGHSPTDCIVTYQKHRQPITAMSGGNWKDLFKAAGEGNLQLIRGHLKYKVDPNYQHPEYFTAPVFEAIRAGQLEALKILFEHGGSLTLLEESTEKTPLEVAMSEGRHDIVEFLSSVLEAKDIRPFCKRIAIAGQDLPLHIAKATYTKLLEEGHQTVIVADCYDKRTVNVEQLAQELRQSTKNQKVKILSTMKDLCCVDAVIIFVTTPGSEEILEECVKATSNDASCRFVLLFNAQASDAVSAVLKSRASNSTAMEFYDSWLNRMTKCVWQEKWLESVAWIATEKDSAVVCGKVQPYDCRHKILASAALF